MQHLLFDPDAKVEYVSAARLTCKAGEVTQPRRTAKDCVLLLGDAGSLRITVDGAAHTLTAGGFFLLFPDKEYSVTCVEESVYFRCQFRLPPPTDGQGLALPSCGKLAAPARAQTLFVQLIDTAHRDGPYRDSLCGMSLMLLLAELATAPTEDSAAATAAKVAEWIRLSIKEIGSAKDVAAHFGYNCEYLTTALRRTTGKTLTEHIRDARMEEAMNLLLCSDLSVKEIAYRCGFSDEKYFLKVFRTATGKTPGQYRNDLH